MPKTTEVSKLQHIQRENFEAQQSILSLGFQVQLNESRHKVNTRNKPVEIKIEQEQAKSTVGNKDKSRKHNKNKAQKNNETHYLKRSSSSYIDIII